MTEKNVVRDVNNQPKERNIWLVNPLYSGNPKTRTFTNSKDPDEMQPNAAFHQALHCL